MDQGILMSQVLSPEQVVEKKLKEATGADISIEQMDALNEKLFENLYKNLYKECCDKNITKMNVLRGIFKALDIGVETGHAPKLVHEVEAKIGGFFAQLFEKRILVLSKNMRQEEQALFEEARAAEAAELAQTNTEKLNDQGVSNEQNK
jgi:hypothetical protein